MTVESAIVFQQRAWAFQAERKLDDALQACSEALRLMEESEGPDSPDVANLLNDLAEIETERQNFLPAIALTERALGIMDRLGDRFTGDDAVRIRLKTLELRGTVCRTLGDYPEAELDFKTALADAIAQFGDASAEAAQAHNNLGVVYKYWGRFDDGLRHFRDARPCLVPNSLDSATVYHNIGGILHARGDFTAAEEPARKAWDISRTLLGEDDPRTMLDAAAYAGVLVGLGKYDESERIYRRALASFEKIYGPDHYEVAANLHGLAAVLTARGAFDDAETHYRRALHIKESVLGADAPDTALTQQSLGDLMSRTGRVTEAVALLQTALAVFEKRLKPDHPYLSLIREKLWRMQAGLLERSQTPSSGSTRQLETSAAAKFGI